MGKRTIAFLSWLLPTVWAAPAAALDLSEADLRVGGYVDGGRFQLADNSVDGEVMNRMGARWSISKEIDDNWSALATLHWMFWRNQATDRGLFHVAGIKFDSDLQGVVTYANEAHRARVGLYEFKYNRDAKNLGEYLLRSEAYPTIVENAQGKDLLAPAYARVAGMEYGMAFPFFRHTALVYAEQYNIPVNDISLVYLAAVGPEAAELGFGASWHRAFKLGKKTKTTVLSQDLRDYVDSNGLDAQAVKVSLRGRVDVGALAGSEDLGFRVYAEAALLGLKNDTLFYKEPLQRMPVMAGLDIPTFGILNTLSVEAEYFKNPYFGRKYPTKDATGSNFSPLPYIDDYAPANLPSYDKDDLKWSIYAHKSLNNWLDLKMRAASDHLRLLNWDGDFEGGEPMTKRTGDWYILFRIEYHN